MRELACPLECSRRPATNPAPSRALAPTAGKTAYYGFKALSHSKKGEKVFVTSAYGPVGQMVIQVAKAAGCEVIASAGTDEKVAYLRELGADAAFNYKTSDTLTELQKFGPIAVLWDGVGGSTLDAWFAAADRGGRAIEVCGLFRRKFPPCASRLTIISPA